MAGDRTPASSGASLQVTPDRSNQAEDRRIVTVVFADLIGSTRLAERLDPEEMRGLLGDVLRALADRVGRYGGTVDKYIGDAVMAVFGAPVAHEDDAVHALRCALAMRAAVAELAGPIEERYGTRLALRIGVNTGEVVAGALASDVQAAYTVVGDAVNTAQRLESAAEPGEILVGSLTYRQAMDAFAFEQVEGVRARGKARAIEAYRLIGPARASRPATASARPVASVLVGREQELERIAALLEGLASGQGAALAVIGEAGLGKSRLLNEARLRAGGAVTWLEGASAPLAQTIPYSPFIQIVRGAAEIGEDDTDAGSWSKLATLCREVCGDDAEDVMPYLGTVLSLRLPPEVEARVRDLTGDAVGRQVFRATRLFVAALARRRPLVLVFEDLHWVDASTAALLQHVAPLVAEAPLCIIGTTRPERDTPAARVGRAAGTLLGHRYTELRLQPLGRREGELLAHNLLGHDERVDHLAQRLVAKAEGNPFFLEEMVRSLLDLGVLGRDAAGALRVIGDLERVSLPDSLRMVVTARLDRLDDELGRTLKVASVLGRTLLYRVLRDIADGATDLDRCLAELVDLELLLERSGVPEREYWFKHAVTQEVAYESMLVRRRRELHRRVGEAIERLFADRIEEFHGVLAYHYARAEDWTKAQEHLFKAGDQAGRVAADAEALAHYKDAIDAYARAFGDTWDPLKRASLERRIAEALFRRGEHDQAREHLRRALVTLREPLPSNKLRVRLAIAKEAAVQLGHRLLPRLLMRRAPGPGAPGSEERRRIYEILGWIDYYIDPYRIVLSTLRLLDRSEREGYALGIVVGSFGLGFICDLLGLTRIAASYHQRARRVAEVVDAPVARGYSELGLAYHLHRVWDPAAAASQWERAGQWFWQAGDIRRWGAASWGRAWVAQSTGDTSTCRRVADEMARVGRDAADPQVRGWADFLLGWSLAEAGMLGDAEQHLRSSIELLREVPDLPNMCRARSDLGLVLLRQGHSEDALAEVEAAEALVDERRLRGFITPVRLAVAHVYLARAEGVHGRERAYCLEKAGAALRRAAKQSRIDREALPQVHRFRGTLEFLLDRRDAAAREWARGRELATTMGLRHEHAVGLLEAGRRLGDRGLIAGSISELEALGARDELRRAREALERTPVSIPR